MKKINILIDQNIPYLPELLSNLANIHTFEGRKLRREDIINHNCDMLFVRSTTMVNSELLDNTNVRFVATATSGTEHFDKDYLEGQGIAFFDALGSNALSVAEYVIFGILKWAKQQGIDLQGKRLGIIGYGNVGRRVAFFAKYLGLEIWANDPPLSDAGFAFPENVRNTDIVDILENCDIITNHTPLSFTGIYATNKLIDKTLLEKIKTGSLLIHASRGGVVDEFAMIELCKARKITCIVDVWENEPNISADSIKSPLIATPHVAGHAFDGKLKGTLMMAEAFEQFTGLKPDYEVIMELLSNTEKIELGKWENTEIFDILCQSRDIDGVHQQFLCPQTEPPSQHFDNMRKNFTVQREVFPEIIV